MITGAVMLGLRGHTNATAHGNSKVYSVTHATQIVPNAMLYITIVSTLEFINVMVILNFVERKLVKIGNLHSGTSLRLAVSLRIKV